MSVIDLPDASNNPPPPHLTLEQYEKREFEMYAKNKYPTMSHEEMMAERMRNEGSRTEEWPNSGGFDLLWMRRPCLSLQQLAQALF